jgi:adenosine deaminase
MHTIQGLCIEYVVEILIDAVARASSATGTEARIILSTLRHYSTQQSQATVQLAERFKGTHVAGIDLGAYEAGFPIYAHIPAFQYAAQRGIPCTVHAGEARGPESVWEKLKQLRPSRVGHGVRSFLQCNLHALEAAFLPEEIKQRLEKQVRAGYEA